MTLEEAVSLLNEAVDFTGPSPSLYNRILNALEEHNSVNWFWLDEATQETVLIQPEKVRLSVERVVFNDGSIGWWAKYKNSRINAYTTEEEAKAAALRTAETIKRSTWGQK